jgi:hypothetical protein
MSARNVVVPEGIPLYIATWSPGDGVTRYRFFTKPNTPRGADYNAGGQIHTVLGYKNAELFVEAFTAGYVAHESGVTLADFAEM